MLHTFNYMAYILILYNNSENSESISVGKKQQSTAKCYFKVSFKKKIPIFYYYKGI